MIDLAALPTLPLAERANLPDCAAIYFALAANDEILYVGRTRSLRSRWQGGHHRKQQLEEVGGVCIAWLEGNAGSFVRLERDLIRALRPRFNDSPVQYGGCVSRVVRLPPDLDDWLQHEAAVDTLPKTVADKIRELVAKARDAERKQQPA